ncbi:hypothetical protein C9374_008247 [Naegleria lovaniensis]|uniref:Uncharacterized protein n=1 Tax=Naegleria lovaniensis TaxID=51637 RepID=A0AA88GLX1_NAELO|nr:uncharacterized protein C9374_008247 [Naegleria lovaniensis]KAG2378608.1 hypothetical protein C9374_008247 [Naegleria lovaniensis]
MNVTNNQQDDANHQVVVDTTEWVHVLGIHLKQALWYSTYSINGIVPYNFKHDDIPRQEFSTMKRNGKIMRIALDLIEECNTRIMNLSKNNNIMNFLIDCKLLERKFCKLVFKFYAITKMTCTRKLDLLMKWLYLFTRKIITPLRILHVVIFTSIHNFGVEKESILNGRCLLVSPDENTPLLLTVTCLIEKFSSNVRVLQTLWRHLFNSFKELRNHSTFLERLQWIISFKIVSYLLTQHPHCNPYLKHLISVCEHNVDHDWVSKNLEGSNDANDMSDRFIQQYIKFTKIYRASHISTRVAKNVVAELFRRVLDQNKGDEMENEDSILNNFNMCLNSVRAIANNCKTHFLNKLRPEHEDRALKLRFTKAYLYNSYIVWKQIIQYQGSFTYDLHSPPFWNSISSHFDTVAYYNGAPLILCLALEFLAFRSVLSSLDNIHADSSQYYQQNSYETIEECINFSMDLMARLKQEMNASYEIDTATVIEEKILNFLGKFHLKPSNLRKPILDLLLQYTFAAYFLIQKFEGYGRSMLHKQIILDNFPMKHLSDFLNGSTERGNHYRKQLAELRYTLHHVSHRQENEQNVLSTLMFISRSIRRCSSKHPLAVCFFDMWTPILQKYLKSKSEQGSLASLCEIISFNILE